MSSFSLLWKPPLAAVMVKNPPANAGDIEETWIRSPGQEDPLEEGMTTHSSILAWRIPWTEEPGGYSQWGHKELDTTEQLNTVQHSSMNVWLSLGQ